MAGRPRSSATPSPTTPKSPSAAWRPAMMRSKSPIFRIAAARVRAVVKASDSSKAVSIRSTPSSAPLARPAFSTARALSGPIVTTVILTASPRSSLILSAASTACSSNGLITGATPDSGMIFRASSSIRKTVVATSGSKICFMQTTICKIVHPPNRCLYASTVISEGTMPSKCLRR